MIARVFPYTHLRQHYDCAPSVALLLATMSALAWLLLRLESPNWRAVLDQPTRWYPQLANKTPSLGDPLRYVVQSLWLLLVRPARPQARTLAIPAWLKSIRDSPRV